MSTPIEDPPLDPGANPSLYTMVAWSAGALPGGGWSVRSRGEGSIVVRTVLDGAVGETTITAPGAFAFLPTAALDATGRLHIAWYDSAGATGRRASTSSRSTPIPC